MPSSMLKSSPATPPPADFDEESESAFDGEGDIMQVEQKAVNFTNWLLVRVYPFDFASQDETLPGMFVQTHGDYCCTR